MRECSMETVTRYETRYEQRVTGYRVTVDHYGLQFTINRNFEPQVGQSISVNVSAW